jgi:hypothetical protein
MDRPGSTVIGKVFCLWLMPIATQVYRIATFEKLVDLLVQGRDHFIAVRHGQCTTGTKIVLHINHD